jgi:hypothetical protein
MARLKALTRHTANQRTQNPGDLYDADDVAAKLIKGLGWAEDAPSLVQAVVAAASKVVRPRRKYQRRDMTAKP